MFSRIKLTGNLIHTATPAAVTATTATSTTGTGADAALERSWDAFAMMVKQRMLDE